MRQHPQSRHRRGDLAGGAPQQPHPEDALERGQCAGHGGLGDPERDGGVGEGALIDDRDETAQLPQLHIHDGGVLGVGVPDGCVLVGSALARGVLEGGALAGCVLVGSVLAGCVFG